MSLKNAFISGIAAGIMVGIGGAVYMSCDNKYVGASFFSVALLSICYLGMYLYTGRIGYLAEKFEDSTLPVLGMGLVGNFVGANCFRASLRVCKTCNRREGSGDVCIQNRGRMP